jgi:hypothetical protein
MKLCKDCANFRDNGVTQALGHCVHPKSVYEVNPVTGIKSYRTAIAMRSEISLCQKIEPRYFEQKKPSTHFWKFWK